MVVQQAELREGQGGWCPSESVKATLKGESVVREEGGAGNTFPGLLCSRQDPALWPRLAVNLKDHPASASLVLGFTSRHAPLPSSTVPLNGRSAVAFKASGQREHAFQFMSDLDPRSVDLVSWFFPA